jgi:hypothetical protein
MTGRAYIALSLLGLESARSSVPKMQHSPSRSTNPEGVGMRRDLELREHLRLVVGSTVQGAIFSNGARNRTPIRSRALRFPIIAEFLPVSGDFDDSSLFDHPRISSVSRRRRMAARLA